MPVTAILLTPIPTLCLPATTEMRRRMVQVYLLATSSVSTLSFIFTSNECPYRASKQATSFFVLLT